MKATLIFRILLATVLLAGFSACSPIEPWVKPYERDRLADPIMALDPDPVSTAYIHHVFEAREGSRREFGSIENSCKFYMSPKG